VSASIKDYAAANVDELRAVVSAVSADQLDELAAKIAVAPRVFLTGVGRSGLVAKALAMRLMHIGVAAYAVGEVATPGIDSHDLLVAFSASGRGSVVEQARVALKHDATVASVSTSADGDLAQPSSIVVVLPIRSTVPTEQHAGSLFEQSCLVIGDAVCRAVQDLRGASTSDLDRRHANLS